jgi:hypothetical protein
VSTANHTDRTRVGHACLLFARGQHVEVVWVVCSQKHNKLRHVWDVLGVVMGCDNGTSAAVREMGRYVDGVMPGSLAERMYSPCLL